MLVVLFTLSQGCLQRKTWRDHPVRTSKKLDKTAFYQILALAVGYFVILNVFEAAQQYYYINSFNLAGASQVTFFDLLSKHSTRWLVWGLSAVPLAFVVAKYPINKASLSASALLQYCSGVLVLLLLTIALISLLQLWQDAQNLFVFHEYFVFIAFQKSALFVNAYLGVILLVHLYLNVQALEMRIVELADLKGQYQNLYDDLKSKPVADSETILRIKVGNNVKAIVLSDVVWVQADDYCVKIHCKQGNAYNLRKSMKELETELAPRGFIRIHRNSIVNQNEIASFCFGKDAAIELKNGTILNIAASRVAKIRSVLHHFV